MARDTEWSETTVEEYFRPLVTGRLDAVLELGPDVTLPRQPLNGGPGPAS